MEIAQGLIFGLLGPNGAGKSTLQKLIRGSLQPSKGDLFVLGQNPWRAGREWRSRIAFVGDLPALPVRLKVGECLEFWRSLYRISSSVLQEVRDSLKLQPLWNRWPGTLSRGQQQRVCWARALMIGADLLLLDEPTNGLDLDSRFEVHSLMRRARERGQTLILTTHDMVEAQELSDQVAILDGGRILAQGTPDGLCQAHLGQALQEPRSTPSLERVYRTLAGRSLYAAGEQPG